MRFDIRPYAGAFPIEFGMPRAAVHRLLGPPAASHPVWDGSGTVDHYSNSGFNVGFDTTGRVNHIGFTPGGVELAIEGRALWTPAEQPDPNPVLLSLDPEPVEAVGFWFFLRLGVTSTGFHDDDSSDRAVTVFVRGGRNEVLADAQPADTSRYGIPPVRPS